MAIVRFQQLFTRNCSIWKTIQAKIHYVIFTLQPFHEFALIFVNSIYELYLLISSLIIQQEQSQLSESILTFLQIFMVMLEFQISFTKVASNKMTLFRSIILLCNLAYSIETTILRGNNTQYPIFILLLIIILQKIDKILHKQIILIKILMYITIRSITQQTIIDYCFSQIISVLFAFLSTSNSSYSIIVSQDTSNKQSNKNYKMNNENKILDPSHFYFLNNTTLPPNKSLDKYFQRQSFDPLINYQGNSQLEATSITCKVKSQKEQNINQNRQPSFLSKVIIDSVKTGIALINENFQLVYSNKYMKQKLVMKKGDKLIEKLLQIQFVKSSVRKSLQKSVSFSEIKQQEQFKSVQVQPVVNQNIALIQQFIQKLENDKSTSNIKLSNNLSKEGQQYNSNCLNGFVSKQDFQSSEFNFSQIKNSQQQQNDSQAEQNSSLSINKMKQCIISHKVLEVFKQKKNITLKDVLNKLFQNQEKMKEQIFRSVNNLNNSNLDIHQSKDLFEANAVNDLIYFIENNDLIIHYKEDKKDVNFVGMRIGFYTNYISQGSQNYVIVEYFDTSKLLSSINQKEIFDYKNRMLASVSHELRTPLNCSIQMLQLLLKKFENEFENQEIQQSTEMLIKPALNSNFLLLNIINDILDFGQINAGKFELIFTSLSLIELVKECIDMIYFQASLKGITIEVNFDSNLPEMINSDTNRIRQVLLNLLSNSLKFTEKGFIRINISLETREVIRVDVIDTGCGIPEDNLQKIFETFGNRENSQILNTLGAGLGMSITNSLAMGLGGNRRMKAKSKINEGSTFSFFIINRDQNKRGCKYRLKDIFNQQVVKWETLTKVESKQNIKQQQSSRQLIFNLMKTSKMTQDLFKSSKLDFNQNIESSEQIQDQKNPAFESQETVQILNNTQQNLITMTFKPTHKFTERLKSGLHKTFSLNTNSIDENQTFGQSTLIGRIPNQRNLNQENLILLYDQNTRLIEQNTQEDHTSIGITASMKEDKSFIFQISSVVDNQTFQNIESCQILEEVHTENLKTNQLNTIKRRNKYFLDQKVDQFTNSKSKYSKKSESFDESHSPTSTSPGGRNVCRIKSSQRSIKIKKQEFLNHTEPKKISESDQKQNYFVNLLRKINMEKRCQCFRILIVDDNDFNIYSLQLLLQTYGFSVDKSTSGNEALQKIEQRFAKKTCCNKYQLIFMDIDMPIKDGHQTTIEILDFYKNRLTAPPIISACSAYVQESEQQKAFRNGMKYYITKPINIKQLEQVLINVFLPLQQQQLNK